MTQPDPEYRVLEDVQVLTVREVEALLRHGNGWARRHIVELGGYESEGRFRFPMHGIRAYQERMAAEYAANQSQTRRVVPFKRQRGV